MKRNFISLLALVFLAQVVLAVDPNTNLSTYYSSINGKSNSASSDALRTQLCTVISTGYVSTGYSSLPNSIYAASTDPSDFYNGSSKTMEDIYSSYPYTSSQSGSSATTCGTGWNKEHTVPQSYFGEESPMKSDAHHVFPTDIKMNSVRSNYPYGENNASKDCSTYGYGHLGTSTFTGYSGTVFDPGEGGEHGSYKGDLARVYFYMVTRYRTTDFTKGTGNISFTYTSGVANLTDYMKNLMLKWHRQDPVSEKEKIRNNAIYTHQKNRNPYVDYPCLVEYIWGEKVGESVELSSLVSAYDASYTGNDCSGGGVDPLDPDYYAPVEGLKDSLLKSKLAEVTWSHFAKRYSYGSGKNNTWEAFWYTDRNEADNSVVDMYSNNKRYFNPSDMTASVDDCDIEHMFPNSWFGAKAGNAHAYCDLHHLVPSDYSANRSKSNRGPGVPTDTTFNNGVWVNGKDANRGYLEVFCPPDEYKGDFARAFFYIAMAYGDTAVWQAEAVPNHMTNSDWHEFLPQTRDLLLEWHRNDPVSEKERVRMNTVYELQGNRNPFIDYPCLVEYIWGVRQGEAFNLDCSDTPVPQTKYTITWSVDGKKSTLEVTKGLRPSAPSVTNCSESRVFVGWTTSSTVSDKPAELYTAATIPAATKAATYYAVYADKETEDGGGEFALYKGELTEGDYVIYYNGKAMKATVASSRLGYAEVIASADKIATEDASIIWHLAQTDGYWRIYNARENMYAASTGTKNQAQLLEDGTDDKLQWTVSGTATYEFVNKANAAKSVNANLRNNGTFGFACYATGTGGALSLYKQSGKVTYTNYSTRCSSCVPEEPNANFAKSTITTTCGGAVNNSLNKGGSEGAVTYSSSNKEVATVDAANGNVVIKTKGKTVITATISASGCYTETTASYELTVEEMQGTIAFVEPITVLQETQQMTVSVETNFTGMIIYESSDPEIATIDATSGLVTALKPGKTTITANVWANDCYSGASAHYELTVTAIPTYTVTWKANGEVVKNEAVKKGSAYELPADPENCTDERVFMGWTVEKDYEHATEAPSDLFNSSLLVPVLTQDTTIYAVYADKGMKSKAAEVTDDLTRETTGVTSNSYAEWSGKSVTSGAVYAGNTAGGNSSIQMRTSNSNSGVITTTSGGRAKSVVIAWHDASDASRIVSVYGSNTAYTSAADLYDTGKQGTLLGSLTKGETTLDIAGSYAYIGIRSKSAALYLTQISITWDTPNGGSETSYSNYSEECGEVFDFKALAATDVTHNAFTANWTEAGVDFYTLDVKSAVKKPTEKEEVVYEKDFTSSLSGWSTNNISGYENVWTHNSSYGAYATSYVSKERNEAESMLYSPEVDLTDVMNAKLTLNHVFRYGETVYLMVFDGEWKELSATKWTAASSWDFVNSEADLSSYVGKTVTIGFKYMGTTEACPTWEIKRITISHVVETEEDSYESIEGYPRMVTGTSAEVSGLKPKTTYYYTVTPEGGVESEQVEVTTEEGTPSTGIEETGETISARKMLINGQMYIVLGERVYDITGQRVR